MRCSSVKGFTFLRVLVTYRPHVSLQSGKRRFIKGRVAVCSNCGILSEDLLLCQRCNHRTDTARTLAHSTITTSGKSSTADSTVVGGRGVSFSNVHVMKQVNVPKSVCFGGECLSWVIGINGRSSSLN